MDQTQQLEDCFLEEEDEVEEELNCGEERQPLAKLRVFKNEHFPETELPLFLGDNVLGRDPSSCTVPLSARSVSKRHAIISLSLLRGSGGCEEVMEALLWDLGSMNGTRRGRFRLTPHVRYALSEGDSVVLADLPCQYICMREEQAGGRLEEPAVTEAQRGRGKLRDTASASFSRRQADTERKRGIEIDGNSAKCPTGKPTEEQRKGGKEATSNRLRANALPKEEIPAQLNVTESSSDSEEEIIGIRKSRAKILDSSQDSGPTCSTLLFPASETVPESEDESCITPSSSVRLAHSVSGKTPTYVSDSEPEMDTEAEASKHEPVPRLDQHGHSGANKENVEPSRASEPVRSRKDQMKSSSHNSDRDPDVEGEEGAGDLPGSVCGNAASGTGRGEPSQGADVQHSEFNMDSDTDVEDEGNRVTVSAPDKNAGPIPAVQPTEFHLDSDTDVEGEEGTGDLPGPTCGNATSSTNRGEPLQGPNVQRTEFNMDSDTDVEDEGNGVTASEPGPSAGPVPAIKPVESLDSGRDVEESSEDPSGMSPRCNSGAGQANVKPQKLCFDSCVDAEDAKVKALVPTAAAVNALEILSDSDTDVEEELEPTPCSNTQAAIPSTAPAMSTACLQPDSDTDVEEGEPVKHQPAAKAEVDPKDFNMGSDTDVEDEAGQGTPKRPAGPGCSTPLEQALQEEMETQAFLDTSDPFRRPQIPPLLKPRPLDDSQDDSAEDDLVIAATQCYVPEGGKGSPAVDPALEATQPFAMDPSPAENMEDEPTQAFSFQLGLSIGSECTQPIGQVDSEAESELQATQAYGEAPLRGNTVEMDADPGHGSHIGISETQPIATWEMGAREGEQEEAEAVEEEEWKGRGRRHKGKLPSGKEAREKKKRLEKEERERVEREKWEKVREKKEKERLEQVRKEQKEKERLESEKKEREEKERLEREKREEEERERKENERKEKEREMLEKEQKEQEERERLENEKKEREKTEWLEKEKKEREEKERLEKEKRENEERQREENERKERERERLEKERKEQEERLDNEKKERLEKEEKEREEQKRLEREKREEEERQRKENERKERERERLEKERKEQEERERLELEKKEREEKERLEKEVKEREEKERLEKEKREEEERQRKEKERKERERMEKERKEQEERESLENEKKEREEKERLEKEQKERQEKERKEHEKERLEKEQERKEQEERESLEAGGETAPRRGRRSRSNSISSVTSEQSNCSSTGAQGRGRGRGRRSQRKIGPQTNSVPLSNKSEEPPGPKPGGRGRRSMKEGSSGATDTETDLKATLPTSDGTASTRGRRVIGKDSAVTEEDQTMETMETPVPKASSRGRARGRKVNDCNSTAAEEDLATETVETQSAASSGPKSNSRVRGRGRKMNDSDSETAEVDQTTENVETSNTETSSYNEIGRGNKVSDSDSMTAEVGQTTENVETSSVATVVPKTNSRARGRGRKVMEHDSRVVGGDQTTESVETQSVSAVSTPVPKASSKVRARGRKLSDSNSTAAEVDQTSEIVETPSVTAPAPEANSRGRGQIVENLDSTAAEVDQTTNDVETSSVDGTAPRANTRVKGRGRKVTMSDSASAEIDKETPEGVGTSEEMVPTKSRGRAKGQKRALEVETEEVDGTFKVPRGKSERDGRGEEKEEEGIEINEPSPSPKQRRVTAKQGKTIDPKKEAVKDKVENEEALKNSEDQDAPQTPTGRNSRKRLAPIESPPSAKTPRRSVACAPSPGTGAKSKAVAPKVLFTCVTDEAGEAVVARLGGSMAKGVNDMTHLVTDKVRRTVKFLCAMARGVPIVTTAWLEKSGKSGSFLSPSAYLVKDKEQEKRFNFSLEESLRSACTQPLLQGYEIHVTRSVMPEPAQMKDIISSSGARYLPKMPSVSKPQTVVIACVEDASLCAPALSASIPVVSAEFLLTGILQQRVDLVAHALSGPGFEAGAKGGAKRKRK